MSEFRRPNASQFYIDAQGNTKDGQYPRQVVIRKESVQRTVVESEGLKVVVTIHRIPRPKRR